MVRGVGSGGGSGRGSRRDGSDVSGARGRAVTLSDRRGTRLTVGAAVLEVADDRAGEVAVAQALALVAVINMLLQW